MTYLDRRHFLGAAGAGVASAGFAATATDRIRVGILGIQHSHLAEKLKAMSNNSDYALVSVCEPDQAARHSRDTDPLLRRLRWVSMDELLSDKSIDLIVFEGEVRSEERRVGKECRSRW